jgi:thiamine-monophosphate kinase
VRGEFELIAAYFAPLAGGAAGALGLTDDAALLAPPEGCDLVLAADAMIEGVHFLADEPADLVARKLLRVNLSDLAAMGARPLGYLLTAAWPESTEEARIARFAEGLAEDQAIFPVRLLGGDTTRTPGPLALSLTAVGAVPLSAAAGRAVARDPALGAAIYGGGDDFELAFAAAPERAEALADLAGRLGLAITRIGELTAGAGVRLVDESGQEVALSAAGWTHF